MHGDHPSLQDSDPTVRRMAEAIRILKNYKIRRDMGLDFVKFFPAEPAGGLKMIKAVAAPYGQLVFMPTGGLTPENVRAYLADEKILACGGSWMVKQQMMADGDWEGIAKLVREAAAIVKEVRGRGKQAVNSLYRKDKSDYLNKRKLKIS